MNENELRKLYFRAKLASEAQLLDIVRSVEAGTRDFVLLDARPREAYDEGHLPSACSLPLEEVDTLVGRLAFDQRYVTYCWRST